MNDTIRPTGDDEVRTDAADNIMETIVPSSVDAEEGPAERPRVTFMGNTYDMTSLFAFAGGILVLASCFTCGQIFYCLPVIPVILGIIGLMMANQSIDAKRTRLWSWLGIGGGAIALIIFAIAVVAYFAFVVFVIWMGAVGN